MSFRQRARPKPATEVVLGSPAGQGNQLYLDARAEWNERYGSYIRQAKMWRWAALTAIAVAGVAVVGLAYVGSQTHLVPFVVEVNQLGDALAATRADVATSPDTRLIRAQIARWVDDVRTVYSDSAAERAIISEAYGMVDRSGVGFQALNNHFRSNDPFVRAKDETVVVHVSSVLPISQDTWRIEWSEETRARDGSEGATVYWRATVTISVHPPSDYNTILVNPTGLYVEDFSWSKAQ